MPKDLLYEIGVEEIPAGFVLPALEQLEKGLRQGLADLRLSHGDICTFGTPRRLTVIVKQVADAQPDIEQEYKGPPADRAFDESGKPTKAAEGFANTRGVSVDQLEVRETDKGSWVFVTVMEAGRPAEELLPGLLERVTLGLTFPKTMRWADLDLRFARPLRWLAAILGDTVLDLSIAGVQAGRTSRGHRILHPGELRLGGADTYLDDLRAAFVMADHVERREAIRAAATQTAEELGGRARIKEDLLTEVSFLVEWPTCLHGRFDPRYLELPDPVIVTVMQGHQRYFPVEDADGKLMPFFITVRNGGTEGMETVRKGNEKVIEPRLADAEFYLTEDLKQTLEQRVQSLARVTFMEGLGTLADKTRRLERLATHLAVSIPLYAEDAGAIVERAAHLCKADLVTLMVGDSKLGELQGQIGGEYARRMGEEPAVALAVAEHYRPRGAGDAIPESPAGTLLSISDKVDNLAACFRLGAVPTGSNDPFALRRQAQGIVEMITARRLHLDLRELLVLAVDLMPEPALEREKDRERVLEPAQAVDALLTFFGQRIEYLLTQEGVTYDVIRAVLGTEWTDVLEVFQRARFLHELRTQEPERFDTLVTSAERPARITRPEQLPADQPVDESLFEHDRERELWALHATATGAVRSALESVPVDYNAAVTALTALATPIHQYFEDVMVMVDDAALRTNRLLMLREIDRVFRRVADFLQIVREGE
ncbi:MAG: glycine--tRNA ligase subunit beta [Armatimonadetes bacterium]|nr:glycine--tRNA ligase subunit beta [Armatimonadota bacterium]